MDKKEWKKKIILGLSAGLVTLSSASNAEDVKLNTRGDYLFSAGCGGKGGCGGLTAIRDIEDNSLENDEDLDQVRNQNATDAAKIKEGDDYKKGVRSRPISPASPDSDSYKNSQYRRNSKQSGA